MVDGKPFRIGPTEGLKLLGFPEDFRFPVNVSLAQQINQLGNSVEVPALEAFARAIYTVLKV